MKQFLYNGVIYKNGDKVLASLEHAENIECLLIVDDLNSWHLVQDHVPGDNTFADVFGYKYSWLFEVINENTLTQNVQIHENISEKSKLYKNDQINFNFDAKLNIFKCEYLNFKLTFVVDKQRDYTILSSIHVSQDSLGTLSTNVKSQILDKISKFDRHFICSLPEESEESKFFEQELHFYRLYNFRSPRGRFIMYTSYEV